MCEQPAHILPCDVSFVVGCSVVRAGQMYDVTNGDFFVDVDNCQRCLCNNGEATFCEASVCTGLQRSPRGCTFEGVNYGHGDTFEVSP